MDTDVLSHTSLSEEKLGTAHTTGPHVICGILSQSVSAILLGEKANFFKTKLEFWPFTQMYPVAVAPGRCTTEMGANLTHYSSTIEIEILGVI